MDYINEINQIYNEEILNEDWKSKLGALGLAAGLGLGGADKDAQASTYKEPTPVTKQASQSIPIDYSDLFDYISKSEGKGKPGRPGFKYNDSKGLPTIGIGHLITKDTPGIFRSLFGSKANINGMLSGRVPMSDSEMFKLFQRDVQKKIDTAQRLVPAFDTYPQYVKNAIVDGLYRGDLGPDTRGFINAGDFKAAAKEYLNHGDYRKSVAKNKAGKPHGVKGRMERNRDAFLKYSGTKPVQVDFKQRTSSTRTSTPDTYTIQAGDSFSKVAKRFNLSVNDILKANPGVNPRKLQIGQDIKLK